MIAWNKVTLIYFDGFFVRIYVSIVNGPVNQFIWNWSQVFLHSSCHSLLRNFGFSWMSQYEEKLNQINLTKQVCGCENSFKVCFLSFDHSSNTTPVNQQSCRQESHQYRQEMRHCYNFDFDLVLLYLMDKRLLGKI